MIAQGAEATPPKGGRRPREGRPTPGTARVERAETPRAWVLVEAESGEVLAAHDADAALPVDGLERLMIVLLCLEQEALGELPLDVPVVTSPLAAGPEAGGNRVPLRADKDYLLEDLVKAIAVSSADDAALATAEAIAGSIPNAIELMNARAVRMGLGATAYTAIGGVTGTAEGESSAGQDGLASRTSALDAAHLVGALLEHRRVLDWTSLPGFPFDRGSAVLRNANLLVGGVAGVDGLQVAENRAGKDRRPAFHVVATARRDGMRLVAVVLGATDSSSRYGKAAELLEWGFSHFERVRLVKKGTPVQTVVRVAGGAVDTIAPVAQRSLSMLHRRGLEEQVRVRFQLPAELRAPVRRHEIVGELVFEVDGKVTGVVPLLSPAEVGARGPGWIRSRE